MIPVMIIPVINRPDLLRRTLLSVDVDVARLVVIDNSPAGGLALEVLAGMDARPAAWMSVVEPPSNLGVAASWNFGIRSTAEAPWWCIANADTEFGSGDLARLAAAMDEPGARWVGLCGDWRAFGINAECIDRVGWYDENYFPIYCEDADYEWRCTVMGVPWSFIDGTSSHVGSVSWRSDAANARSNARTYPENVAYYEAKWGGRPRGGERFTSPHDRGGSVADWRLDLDRLRRLRWI